MKNPTICFLAALVVAPLCRAEKPPITPEETRVRVVVDDSDSFASVRELANQKELMRYKAELEGKIAPKAAEERIAQLEQQVAALMAENAALRGKESPQPAPVRMGWVLNPQTGMEDFKPLPVNEFDAAVLQSRERAFARWPQLAKEPTAEKLRSFIASIRDTPARQKFFENPDWPERVAEEYARLIGLQPSK